LECLYYEIGFEREVVKLHYIPNKIPVLLDRYRLGSKLKESRDNGSMREVKIGYKMKY